MAQIILVRHGQTDWGAEGRVQGALDIPLNKEGEKEAQTVSGELSKFEIDAIYSSPISCCFSTAHKIAAKHGLKVKKMPELMDLNQGLWQGLLVKDIKKRYKKQYYAWKAAPVSGGPPKGESIRSAYDRAISAVHKIVDRHKDRNVCVVSGDLILSLIKSNLTKTDFENMWKSTREKIWWEAIEL